MAWGLATNIKGPPGDVQEAPPDGQQYGRNGATATWTVVPDEVVGGKVTISATAPPSPVINDVWIDTS
jgi:hypothetical protein